MRHKTSAPLRPSPHAHAHTSIADVAIPIGRYHGLNPSIEILKQQVLIQESGMGLDRAQLEHYNQNNYSGPVPARGPFS